MSGVFKFDFSPSTQEDEVNNVSSLNESAKNANELTAKLTERLKINAGACTLLNVSCRIFPVENDMSESPDLSGGECGFKPHLRFHPHESVELRSNKMDGLRYVIPTHTLSDETTDLIPGVYEGGLKVWECSVDLCRFLARVIDDMSIDASSDTSTASDADLAFSRAAVRRSLGPGGSTMELGCGHGLPGCLILRESIRRTCNGDNQTNGTASKSDAKSVVIFTDFNDFVLHHATIPNAQLNVCGLRGDDDVAMDELRTANALMEQSIFAGGDWMGLSHKLSSDNFPWPAAQRPKTGDDNRLDLVLASETTYTPDSCEDTAFLMMRHLKIGDGVGLVATKRFYFGVGGGTDLFKTACEKLSNSDQEPYSGLRLCVEVIQSYDTGNANIRDLLCISLQRKAD